MFWLIVSGDRYCHHGGRGQAAGMALCLVVDCETGAHVSEDQEAETLGWNQK